MYGLKAYFGRVATNVVATARKKNQKDFWRQVPDREIGFWLGIPLSKIWVYIHKK